MMPWCSTDMDMTVTFEATSAYVYDPKNPGYDFSLAVYNKCGQLDDGISISFEEAIKNLESKFCKVLCFSGFFFTNKD